MKYITTIIGAILLIYGVLFCMFNLTPVTVTFIPKKVFFENVPVFLPIMIGAIVGVLLVIWIYLISLYRLKGEIRRLKKQLAEGEKEVQRISSLSFAGDDSMKAVLSDDKE